MLSNHRAGKGQEPAMQKSMQQSIHATGARRSRRQNEDDANSRGGTQEELGQIKARAEDIGTAAI